MSKKSERLDRLLGKIELSTGVPDSLPEGTLFELGMLLVLRRELSATRAQAGMATLKATFDDWNEARVSQVQELARCLLPDGSDSPTAIARYVPAAFALKEYMQEVFQKIHGLDLEFLREDENGAARRVPQITTLGNSLGSVLLWCASEGALPVTTAITRTLDRLDLVPRTSSISKLRASVEPLVGSGSGLRVSMGFGRIADEWCDQRKPLCWECVLVDDCAHGKNVRVDWMRQQERHAAHAAKEEARRRATEERERARLEKEAERERKRAEAEALRAERVEQRRSQLIERKQAAAAKKAAAKKAAAKKAAAKKAAAQKAAAKKAAAKKAAAQKAAAKKAAAKKAAAKKAAAKKAAAKKAAVRKAAAKKAPKKKVAAKKKPATKRVAAKKKPATRKTAPKKNTAKKKPATKKGVVKRKSAAKKKSAGRASGTGKAPRRR